MDIEFLSWEIKEPVRSRPFQGALVGGLTGLLFGFLADQADFAAARSSILMGYGLGGLVGGLMIGACLPLFRSRLVAGIVVSVAASIALLIMHWFWSDFVYWEMSVFTGCAMGFAYGVLLWKYEPDQ